MKSVRFLFSVMILAICQDAFAQTPCVVGFVEDQELKLHLASDPAVSGIAKLTASVPGISKSLVLGARCFDLPLKEGLSDLFDVKEERGVVVGVAARSESIGGESPPLVPFFSAKPSENKYFVSWFVQLVRSGDGQTLTCLRAATGTNVQWVTVDGDCLLTEEKAKKLRPYFERAVHALCVIQKNQACLN